jgi:hypothetical protein
MRMQEMRGSLFDCYSDADVDDFDRKDIFRLRRILRPYVYETTR